MILALLVIIITDSKKQQQKSTVKKKKKSALKSKDAVQHHSKTIVPNQLFSSRFLKHGMKKYAYIITDKVYLKGKIS